MKKVILLLLIILTGCGRKDDDKIILTCGLNNANSSTLRFGIELQQQKLFYCEEITGESGEYNYYEADFSEGEFLKIKQHIQDCFQKMPKQLYDRHGQLFQLTLTKNSKDRKIKFYLNSLNKEQANVINSIIRLKEIKFRKSNFHKFPELLLHEKKEIPPPPPPRSGCF